MEIFRQCGLLELHGLETGSNITFRGTISSEGKFKATGSGATIERSAAGNKITGTDVNPTCTFTVSGHR